MSVWRQLTRGVRALIHRSDVDREVADEVQHYLDEATAANIAGGMSPEDAARAARLEIGSIAGLKEEVRDYGWENVISDLLADGRYAIRRLRGEPGFAAVTVLTLAVGIGATTAIFSAVNPILFESLPYPRAGRIAAILEIGRDASHQSGTFVMYRTFAERSRSFDAVAVLKPWQPTITGATPLEAAKRNANPRRHLMHQATGRRSIWRPPNLCLYWRRSLIHNCPSRTSLPMSDRLGLHAGGAVADLAKADPEYPGASLDAWRVDGIG